MAQSEWQRRSARAEELGAEYRFASEILRFYVTIARFQDDFYRQLGQSDRRNTESTPGNLFAQELPAEFNGRFRTFLSVVAQEGPAALREEARQLRESAEALQSQLLAVFWREADSAALPPGPREFFARAFLQP